jgi:FkbM family methyltransferase
MKEMINNLLAYLDIRVTRKSYYDLLNIKSKSAYELDLLKKINPKNRNYFLDYLERSKSQINQDLFVLSELNFKTSGFFVEFGATNGVSLSNSYLLETEFGWSGILAEPARVWHKDLKKNRKAHIENKCVWKKTGDTLIFNEAEIGELSTLDSFTNSDKHSKKRKNGSRYSVETISLQDLLVKFNAPSVIDYLSIDTEGSEFEILENFDFDKYKFRTITCEHNNTSTRESVYELLTKNGYKRKFTDISWFDDWYVLENV